MPGLQCDVWPDNVAREQRTYPYDTQPWLKFRMPSALGQSAKLLAAGSAGLSQSWNNNFTSTGCSAKNDVLSSGCSTPASFILRVSATATDGACVHVRVCVCVCCLHVLLLYSTFGIPKQTNPVMPVYAWIRHCWQRPSYAPRLRSCMFQATPIPHCQVTSHLAPNPSSTPNTQTRTRTHTQDIYQSLPSTPSAVTGRLTQNVYMRCWTFVDRGFRTGAMQARSSSGNTIYAFMGSQAVRR